MAEYIDRAALLNKLCGENCHRDFEAERAGCENCYWANELAHAPAADVAPVVHSYWEEYSCSQYMGTDECGEPKWSDGRFYVCHNNKCRRKTVIKSNYCPNCGAIMDGGDNNEAD